MIKILLVAGARPNFMKIAPIVRALLVRKDDFQFGIVHTGQHYDREMSDVFFQDLEIPKPDHFLEVGSGSHAEQTARIMVRFEKVCQDEMPDLVLVVGDVNSTLACSIVAKKLNVRVAHVEAGLRSWDMAMPEEINRMVTDSISDFFFVTEESAIENLVAEGKQQNAIFFVGHVMIDNLLFQVAKLGSANGGSLECGDLKSSLKDYGVLTLHRPSNVDRAEPLRRIINAVSEVSKTLPIIFPIHPRTQASLKRFKIHLPDQIVITKPLPYMAFLNLFKDARLVMTDSGGLQEETTALGIPCLTLRENTERPITVTEGTNSLVGSEETKIIAAAREILGGKRKSGRRPHLWDGYAAERITEHLHNLLCE